VGSSGGLKAGLKEGGLPGEKKKFPYIYRIKNNEDGKRRDGVLGGGGGLPAQRGGPKGERISQHDHKQKEQNSDS